MHLQVASAEQLAELCEGSPAACQIVGAAINFGCLSDQDLLDHPDQLHVTSASLHPHGKLLR